MGDVLHNLPVVNDVLRHIPDAQIDWVVEENFASLPALHPGVRHILPVAIRRWRKSWWLSRKEVFAVCRNLQEKHYDIAVDTQGLLKSALIARCASSQRCGFDWRSAREPLASLLYDRTFSVAKNQHAVERNRQLAAQALGYSLDSPADYGIQAPTLSLPWLPSTPYVAFLHATSRDDKLWNDENWITLGKQLSLAGIRAVLPWGNEQERIRSERLCTAIPFSICPPRINLHDAAALVGHARASVGVDTGLSHLSVALGVPTVGIYVSTDPDLTGLYAGRLTVNLGKAGTPPSVAMVLSALAQIGIYV